MKKDIVILVTAALSATMLFLGTVGIAFDWFSEESINAFGVLLGAVIALSIALFGIYKNTYAITGKARRQDEELKKRGLK